MSVIMPVFNTAAFLPAALSSVFKQTFLDFELLAVDDGSNDGSSEILAAQSDRRLRVLTNRRNIGYTRSINRALAQASGDYIARMDSDDISATTRLERQVEFLNANPEVGLVGSAYQIVDRDGSYLGARRMPATDVEVRWASLLSCPFAHPSVVFRRSVLVKSGLAYDPAFEPAEDYELWTRMLAHTHGANLTEILLYYRPHGESTSAKRGQEQMLKHDKIALRTIGELLPKYPITKDLVTSLRKLVCGELPSKEDRQSLTAEHIVELYLDLFDAFRQLYPFAMQVRSLRDDLVAVVSCALRSRSTSRSLLQVNFRLLRTLPTEASRALLVSALNRLKSKFSWL